MDERPVLAGRGPFSRREFLRLAGLTAGATAVLQAGGVALAKPPKAKADKYDTPALRCASANQVSLDVEVCAGGTGALAGFSLQWMTAADFAANNFQWYLSDDPRLCKASFSGQANLSRYDLGPNQCVTVRVGDFLFDNGASTNCATNLVCGTEYVFRAFAHADNTRNRSDFTPNLACTTLSCGSGDSCTFTQGYWKTHGPDGCRTGNNEDEWPVASLTLGTVAYTDLELCTILNRPAQGNGLIALAHQLIAAKLNVANGADPTDVATAITDADALIGGLVVPPVGAGWLHPSTTSTLTTALANYNEGGTGPGHCD